MGKIKAKDTGPEMVVRKFLHGKGFRYSLCSSKLPGKPDIVLKKYKIVINVNGCFWHGHKNCKYYVIPKTRTEWWQNKINNTVERDRMNTQKLEKNGWKVIVIWGCKLKPKERTKSLEKLIRDIID
ncbi:MAG: DNA mismatch endonuclease Vsr [Cytophagia bacterium]|jgi:DNA mismatch endonuclease, patch repair protein|nr:DNA mismatch endonuclease Vsr [Cytophagia bacterium]